MTKRTTLATQQILRSNNCLLFQATVFLGQFVTQQKTNWYTKEVHGTSYPLSCAHSRNLVWLMKILFCKHCLTLHPSPRGRVYCSHTLTLGLSIWHALARGTWADTVPLETLDRLCGFPWLLPSYCQHKNMPRVASRMTSKAEQTQRPAPPV